MLFEFTFHSVREDIKYIMARFFPGIKQPKSAPSRNTMDKNNSRILVLNDFSDYSADTKKLVEARLSQSIQQLNNPQSMLRELLIYMENAKLLLPSYSTIQDLIPEFVHHFMQQDLITSYQQHAKYLFEF